MKRRSWLIIVTFIISMVVACEIPVEPVEVTVNSSDYIELNWITAQPQWGTDACLTGSHGLMYVTGQNPSCDLTEGEEFGLLRIHSFQHESSNYINALLDYSEIEYPEVIYTQRISLYSYVYEEK